MSGGLWIGVPDLDLLVSVVLWECVERVAVLSDCSPAPYPLTLSAHFSASSFPRISFASVSACLTAAVAAENILPHHPPPPPPAGLAAGCAGALSTTLGTGTDVGAAVSAPCASRISSLVLALPVEAGVYALPVALVVELLILGVVGLEVEAGFAANIFSNSPKEFSSSSALALACFGAGLGLAAAEAAALEILDDVAGRVPIGACFGDSRAGAGSKLAPRRSAFSLPSGSESLNETLY